MYALRPGCHLERAENPCLIDELRQVEIRVNDSGYEVLNGIEGRTVFSDDEMVFLASLLRLALILPKDLLDRAVSMEGEFEALPPGPYRMAAV
ncbi:MAG: hypothetical protein ACYC9Q_09375 [Bacillota bacterium]